MNVPTHYKARPYQLFSFKTQSADRTVKPITQTYDIQFEFMPYCWYDLHLPRDLNFQTILKMRRIQSLAFVWTVITMKIGFVFSDIHFLERHEGESVVLSCVVEQRNPSPFGVYLKRSWLRPSQVLFMHTKSEFTAGENDKNRTRVSGDPSNRSLNVTISQLRVSDTDRYHCEFVADNPFSEDIRIQGKTEFFLLVKAGDHCSCSTYSTLLYALFSAVAILILLLLFGLVVIYKGKARHSVKSQHQAPIYEEMVGVHPHRRKVAPNHLEEMETSEYRNCQVKKSCLENHYEIPSGALSPQIESQK